MTVAKSTFPRAGRGQRWAASMLLLWVVATLSQAACTRKVSAPAPPPPQGPSLVPDSVQVIFTDNCAFSGCHAGTGPAAGMDLGRDSSYAALVGVPSRSCAPLLRVRPSRPDSSCLMLRLTSTVAPQMPLGGSLTPAQIAVVRGWIEQGAGPAVAAAEMFASAWKQVWPLDARSLSAVGAERRNSKREVGTEARKPGHPEGHAVPGTGLQREEGSGGECSQDFASGRVPTGTGLANPEFHRLPLPEHRRIAREADILRVRRM